MIMPAVAPLVIQTKFELRQIRVRLDGVDCAFKYAHVHTIDDFFFAIVPLVIVILLLLL